jgi:metal-responsive CopG/Arc/MetJ family transcriptional regulator
MKRVLVNLTDVQLEELDELLKKGLYKGRSQSVRDAVRILIEKEKLREIEKKLGE